MYIVPPTAQQIQERWHLDIEVATTVFAVAGALLVTHAMGELTYDPIWAMVTEWMGTTLLLVSGWETLKLMRGKNYFSTLSKPNDHKKVEAVLSTSSYGQFYLEEVRSQGRSYTYGEWSLARHWSRKEKLSRCFKRQHFR